MNSETIETHILTLGEAKIPSPMLKEEHGGINHLFVSDEDQVMINIKRADIDAMLAKGISPPAFEVAGPRRKVYFDASKLRCAIATCGGLCPGLNDIIRAIVLELHYRYGVKIIYGVAPRTGGVYPRV